MDNRLEFFSELRQDESSSSPVGALRATFGQSTSAEATHNIKIKSTCSSDGSHQSSLGFSVPHPSMISLSNGESSIKNAVRIIKTYILSGFKL